MADRDLRARLLARPDRYGSVDLATLDTAATPKARSRRAAEHELEGSLGEQLADLGDLVYAGKDRKVLLVLQGLDGSGKNGTISHGRALARRAREVNLFEQELVEDGTVVIKCMLHISHDEQRERFLRRLRRTDKRWKFNEGDLDTRDRWTEFQAAYGAVLGCTSTAHAPWFVVPSDHKWYRNWAIANIIVESLAGLDLQYPQPDLDIGAMRRRLKAS